MPGMSKTYSKRQPKKKSQKKKVEHAPSTSQLKRTQLESELETLTEQLVDPTIYLKDSNYTRFDQLPISQPTQKGLKTAHYVEMTEIQRGSLPLALAGKDILGAAKTGSGKTLAFLIPVLECLYRAKWTPMDGLGALIISPTRELALQIFEVLRKIGKNHSFSAGLLIGGKDLKQEQERVSRMNILVCTPGRLLQHMDQTPDFNADSLQILVLDEADRCLDIGFEKTLNAILDNLPQERQTLLFSATQTKSVKDLARLSLSDPEYVAVHQKAEESTPKSLSQKYIVTELPQKLDILFSFIKSHLKQKIIVFLSSCKQVRFVYETFCKMQPGTPLMHLFGKQKQGKRIAIFEQFCRKQAACLFATDVAARGLDFPAVDWVIQVDCPEDADTYIHRVGRTARYESVGNALLLLLPSEEPGMLKEFEKKKIPVTKIKVNPSKTTSVKGQLQALCSQSPEIKYLGQKCFISYMRSVFLQKNKAVFDVHALPAEAFAESLGLPGAPKISFVKKSQQKNAPRPSKLEFDMGVSDGSGFSEIDDEEEKGKTMRGPRPLSDLDSDQDESGSDGEEIETSKGRAKVALAESDDSSDEDKSKPAKPRTKVDKMFQKKNLSVLSEHYNKLIDKEDLIEDEEGDDFLTLKRADHDIDDKEIPKPEPVALRHREILKTRQKELKKRGLGQKYMFDEDGNPLLAYQLESVDDFTKKKAIPERMHEFLVSSTAKMQTADILDKSVEKQRIKERKAEKKRKERALRQEEAQGQAGAAFGVQLGSADFEEEDDTGSFAGVDDEDFDGESGSYASEVQSEGEEEEPLEIDLDESDVEPSSHEQVRHPAKRPREPSLENQETEEPKKMIKKSNAVKNLGKASLEDMALALLHRS